MADTTQERGFFDIDPTPQEEEKKPEQKEKGFFDEDPRQPEEERREPERTEGEPERGIFADEPAQERGIFADDPEQKREEEKPKTVDQDKDRVTVEVKRPEEERPTIGQGPDGWKAETLQKEENQALRDQQGPEAVQRAGSDVLPNPEGWKGDGPDLRTPDEMAAGVQLEPDEYTRRSSADFYDGMREGDRAGGPSKDRELYDLPELKDRDGFTPGADRDGFTQGTQGDPEPKEITMTGAEIKEMSEQFIDTYREQEKEQFKELDKARADGADPQTIDAMKAQVKDTIGDRLTAESVSKSITPDMANQSFNVSQLTENVKENMAKMQNAVQQYKDAHPSQGIQPHISHSMDR